MRDILYICKLRIPPTLCYFYFVFCALSLTRARGERGEREYGGISFLHKLSSMKAIFCGNFHANFPFERERVNNIEREREKSLFDSIYGYYMQNTLIRKIQSTCFIYTYIGRLSLSLSYFIIL